MLKNINDSDTDHKATNVENKTKLKRFIIGLWMPITAVILLWLGTIGVAPAVPAVTAGLILMVYWGRQLMSIILDDLNRTNIDGDRE